MAQRTHSHAEATYRVIPTEDGAFAVEDPGNPSGQGQPICHRSRR